MLIDIRAIGFNLTDAIRTHVESRVESALGPFARWVQSVTARLEDINADRGGVDKRCSLVVHIRRRGMVLADAVHVDLYAAVDEAAGRVRRALVRELARHVARHRRDPHRPGSLLTR